MKNESSIFKRQRSYVERKRIKIDDGDSLGSVLARLPSGVDKQSIYFDIQSEIGYYDEHYVRVDIVWSEIAALSDEEYEKACKKYEAVMKRTKKTKVITKKTKRI